MPKPIHDPRSPYYQFDFQIRKRRFHGSTRCKTERQAQQYIDRLVARINSGEEIKPEISLDQACLAYWNDKGQHLASGYAVDGQLAKLCSLLGGNRPLSAIGQKEWRVFVAKRRGETARNKKVPVSHATVNREIELARRVWRHVEGDHAVSVIKWGDLKLKEPKERVRELKAAEEQRLIDKLPASLLPIVEFAILTGQRKAAVIGLRWDKIDWREGEATITNKGGGEHSFPLSPAAALLLRAQPVVEGCPFVFTYVCERPAPKRKDRPARAKGVRYPFSVGGWARKWYKALRDAGVSDFRFHDLRHTTATRILRSSGNLKAVSTLLGHTDTRTSSRYAHVMREDLREIMVGVESRNSPGRHLTDAAKTRTNQPETDV